MCSERKRAGRKKTKHRDGMNALHSGQTPPQRETAAGGEPRCAARGPERRGLHGNGASTATGRLIAGAHAALGAGRDARKSTRAWRVRDVIRARRHHSAPSRREREPPPVRRGTRGAVRLCRARTDCGRPAAPLCCLRSPPPRSAPSPPSLLQQETRTLPYSRFLVPPEEPTATRSPHHPHLSGFQSCPAMALCHKQRSLTHKVPASVRTAEPHRCDTDATMGSSMWGASQRKPMHGVRRGGGSS